MKLAEAYFDSAKTQSQNGNVAEAIEVYKKILAITPRHIDSIIEIGRLLTVDDAELLFRFALQLDADACSRHDIAVPNIGQAVSGLGVDELKRIVEILPTHSVALGMLVAALCRTGNINEAVYLYEKTKSLGVSVDIGGSNLFVLAANYHQLGRLQEAERVYNLLLNIDPCLPHVLNNLGLLVGLDTSRQHDSEALFLRAIQLNSDYFDAHISLARLLQRTGKTEGAIAHYKEAVRINNNNILVKLELGILLLGEKIYEDASYIFEHVIAIEPNNVIALRELAKLYFEVGRSDIGHYFSGRFVAASPFKVDCSTPAQVTSGARMTGIKGRGSILLTAPQASFYHRQIYDFSSAFQEIGITCYTTIFQDRRESIHDWLANNDVQAVLEINHTIESEENWPRHIGHAVWIQDYKAQFGKKQIDDVGASDVVYVLGSPKIFGISLMALRRWEFLYPGARRVVNDDDGPPEETDFSITGFLAPPIDHDIVVARTLDGGDVHLKDFLKIYPRRYLSHINENARENRSAIAQVCAHMQWRMLPEGLDIVETIIPRSLDREIILRSIMETSTSIGIYGPTTWTKWPEFAPFYRGYIRDPIDLDRVYGTTRVNIHNGSATIHSRSIDCMAAGGFIMINQTPLDFEEGGICHYFDPDRHYGRFTMDTVADVAQYYVKNKDVRKRIVRDAKQQIRNGHLWKHRALQVARYFDL